MKNGRHISEKRESTDNISHGSLLCSSIWILILLLVVVQAGCRSDQAADRLPPGDPDNGGLWLPEGFEAVVVAESIGRARHLVVNENGDVYVMLRNSEPVAVMALRDTTGDGKADLVNIRETAILERP